MCQKIIFVRGHISSHYGHFNVVMDMTELESWNLWRILWKFLCDDIFERMVTISWIISPDRRTFNLFLVTLYKKDKWTVIKIYIIFEWKYKIKSDQKKKDFEWCQMRLIIISRKWRHNKRFLFFLYYYRICLFILGYSIMSSFVPSLEVIFYVVR